MAEHRARVIARWAVAAALLLVTACHQDSSVGRSAIDFLPSRVWSSSDVDANELYRLATGQVAKALPGAKHSMFIFSGRCDTMVQLRGRVVFNFSRVDRILLHTRVMDALVTADTVLGILAVDILDESKEGPPAESHRFPGSATITRVLAVARQHLPEPLPNDCNVTVTQVARGWRVRCDGAAAVDTRCRFDIIDDGQVASIAR